MVQERGHRTYAQGPRSRPWAAARGTRARAQTRQRAAHGEAREGARQGADSAPRPCRTTRRGALEAGGAEQACERRRAGARLESGDRRVGRR